MGWLWSSAPSGANTPPEKTPDATAERSFALTEEQRQRIFGKPSNLSSGTHTSPQDSDKEIEAFFNSFDSSAKPTPTSSSDPAEQDSTASTSRTNPDGTLSIAPEHLYPRTMSCRQAFDQAFYCQSLGGKFNDIYRYGHLQPCTEQWNAFWFCMRNRTLPMKNKEEVVAAWYEDREKRKKAEFGSSEDVWALRETAVEKAFWRDPDREGEGAGEGKTVRE